ncbi:hypothetical protein CBS101457_004687 [Exobasidium rhododendri]|nr:hypothetical protein CBS101457_004687 [Exobasidium rhododendri]
MLSASGYLLLVATFVIIHRPPGLTDWDAAKAEQASLTKEAPPHESEVVEVIETATAKGDTQVTVNKELPFHDCRRSRLASTVIESERGSVVWCPPNSLRRPTTDQLDLENRSTKQVLRAHSGHSMSSWGRIEGLMNSRANAHRPRNTSGVTYYGSESSYSEGMHTTRNSTFSAFAQAATGNGYGNDVPPVPVIDPRYLQSPSQVELGFAKPLTVGEAPIPLKISKKTPSVQRNVDDGVAQSGGLRKALSAMSSLFQTSELSLQQAAANPSHSLTTLVPIQSRDSPGNLPARYQSSKLFPATDWDVEQILAKPSQETQEIDSPSNSEVKHTKLHDSPGSLVFETKYEERRVAADPHLRSPARVKKTIVIRRESVAEDSKARLTASIMFPKRLVITSRKVR